MSDFIEGPLHPGCIACKKKNTAQEDVVDLETGKIIARKGDFVIQCKGIPLDSTERLVQIFEKGGLSAEIDREDLISYASVTDPVLWAANNVTVLDEETGERGPWIPQGSIPYNVEMYNLDPESLYYQELMVKCTARRAVYKLGRRAGKSWTISIKALHKMVNQAKYRILVVTPNITQLDLIFNRINDFLEMSPQLKDSKARYVKTPQRYIELKNGSYMIGFVSGNESIRGQAADMIIIDEAAYLAKSDLSAITAILTEHKETIMLVASTPSGERGQFYKWDMDPAFRSFHFPSMCRPKWDERMEAEMRKENPGPKYVHEVLAQHGEIAEGVFQHLHLDRAIEQGSYAYADRVPQPGWIYCIGVDWNPVHGTEIVVIGTDSNRKIPKYETVECGQVFREGNTQIQAINEIIAMNRKWSPAFIYVDRGAGSVQIEVLEQVGQSAAPNTPDKRLQNIVKAIDFGSKLEIRNPADGTVQRIYAKPAVVENAVRCLEADQIVLSKYDPNLIRALRGYITDKISANGRPVYKMISDDIEDHRLDAWMLGLFAFMMEFSEFGMPKVVSEIGFTGLFGERVKDISKDVSVPQDRPPKPNSRIIKEERSPRDKQELEKELELNFIPAQAMIESVDLNGTRIRRVVYRPENREERNSRVGQTSQRSRAPIKRSMFK